MAGTVVGCIDAYTNVTYTDSASIQLTFATAWRFFQRMITEGHCTLIASNYGYIETQPSWGGTSGTGMDSYSGSNPAGENAWFVVKFNISAARPGGGSALGEYYVLVQWAGERSFGADDNGSPNGTDGYPARASYYGTGFNGVACAIAFRTDGNSPWNGTTDASEGTPGQAQKGLPVWDDGGTGTLVVLDAANGPYGSYSTNRQSMQVLAEIYAVSTSYRTHMAGDADGFWFIHDQRNRKNYWDTEWFMCNLYVPYSKFPCSYPLICFGDEEEIPMVKGSTYGDTAGSQRFEHGAMIGPDAYGNIAGRFRPHGYPGTMDTSGTFNPISYLSDSTKLTYWACPILLEWIDPSGQSRHGMQGQWEWAPEVYGPGPATISNDGAYLFMNDDTVITSQRMAFPWPGSWPPGYYGRNNPAGYQVP